MQIGKTPVCVREACLHQPVGWGRLVSSANWCATCDLSPPPQHLQRTASHFPFHVPHHILFAIFGLFVASQLLPPTCMVGSILPMAFSLASLCATLYRTYKIHLASPASFSTCPVLPCMPASGVFFPVNPMWNSFLCLVTCLFLHPNSPCPSDPDGEIPSASSVQLLSSSPEGIP